MTPLHSTAKRTEGYSSDPSYEADSKTNLAQLKALETKLTETIEAIDYPTVSVSPARKVSEDPVRLLVFLDIFALVMSFLAAMIMAVIVNEEIYNRTFNSLMHDGLPVRALQILSVGAGLILWFAYSGHYRLRFPAWIEAKKVLSALGFAMLIDGFVQFASKVDASRLWLVGGWVLAGVSIIVMRRMARNIWYRQGRWEKPTILVGAGQKAEDTKVALLSDPQLGYKIVRQIHDLDIAMQAVGNSWQRLYQQSGANYSVIALDSQDPVGYDRHFRELMREGMPFAVVPHIQHFPVHGLVPFYFFNHDVHLWVGSFGLENKLSQAIKRTSDIILSSAAIIALGLPMMMIALLVKLDGGPAFYPDRRLGRNGKKFNCLKFRSMVTNSDQVLQDYLHKANAEVKQEWLAYKKLRGYDPRVTRIGKFLRKTSLDEIPQLLNVLKGDMSLVGPRPILERELEAYNADIAHYYKVRPGITGLWQVSGRNQVTYAERVEMDSWYIRNWSLWHDFAIILKTFPALLLRKGAF